MQIFSCYVIGKIKDFPITSIIAHNFDLRQIGARTKTRRVSDLKVKKYQSRRFCSFLIKRLEMFLKVL